MSFVTATYDEILASLGARLRIHRIAQDLPQHELAQMAGLSLGAVRKLEASGQTSMETLVRVVQALGLVGELENLFVFKRESIAQMEQAESVLRRRRAVRRRS